MHMCINAAVYTYNIFAIKCLYTFTVYSNIFMLKIAFKFAIVISSNRLNCLIFNIAE